MKEFCMENAWSVINNNVRRVSKCAICLWFIHYFVEVEHQNKWVIRNSFSIFFLTHNFLLAVHNFQYDTEFKMGVGYAMCVWKWVDVYESLVWLYFKMVWLQAIGPFVFGKYWIQSHCTNIKSFFLWFSMVLESKWCDNTLTQAMTASFTIPSNASFISWHLSTDAHMYTWYKSNNLRTNKYQRIKCNILSFTNSSSVTIILSLLTKRPFLKHQK